MKYGSILHHPWTHGADPGVIIGVWAEDMSSYEIHVPPQLRDDIIDMQNALHLRYQEMCKLRAMATRSEHEFNSFFYAPGEPEIRDGRTGD